MQASRQAGRHVCTQKRNRTERAVTRGAALRLQTGEAAANATTVELRQRIVGPGGAFRVGAEGGVAARRCVEGRHVSGYQTRGIPVRAFFDSGTKDVLNAPVCTGVSNVATSTTGSRWQPPRGTV